MVDVSLLDSGSYKRAYLFRRFIGLRQNGSKRLVETKKDLIGAGTVDHHTCFAFLSDALKLDSVSILMRNV